MLETAVRTVEEAVAQLDAAVTSLLEVEVDGLSTPGLVSVLREVERHKRRLGALDVALLGQVRERNVAAQFCRPSDADLLVQQLRILPGEAKARVAAAADCGRRVTLAGEMLEPTLPTVAAAVHDGEVSAGHVAVIGATLSKIPAEIAWDAVPVAEALLVEAARHEHPKALERTGALLLARLCPDGVEPRDTRDRGFTLAGHGDGWASPRGNLDPSITAAFHAILDALSAPRPAQDGTPDPRTPAQRRHDALGEMLQRLLRSGTLPDSGGVPTTVVVTGTLDDWLTHAPHGTEAHADTDDAPLDDAPLDDAPPAGAARSTGRAASGLVRGARGEVWRVRDLRPCADPFCTSEVVGITITMSGQPLALGRTSRLAKALLRLALAARDRGCVFPGCTRPPAWCEAHHVIEWHNGGTTDLGNLCLLCSFHHREFGRRGWSVRIAADGLPEWTPPAWIDPQQRPVRNRAHHSDIEFAVVSEARGPTEVIRSD